MLETRGVELLLEWALELVDRTEGDEAGVLCTGEVGSARWARIEISRALLAAASIWTRASRSRSQVAALLAGTMVMRYSDMRRLEGAVGLALGRASEVGGRMERAWSVGGKVSVMGEERERNCAHALGKGRGAGDGGRSSRWGLRSLLVVLLSLLRLVDIVEVSLVLLLLPAAHDQVVALLPLGVVVDRKAPVEHDALVGGRGGSRLGGGGPGRRRAKEGVGAIEALGGGRLQAKGRS